MNMRLDAVLLCGERLFKPFASGVIASCPMNYQPCSGVKAFAAAVAVYNKALQLDALGV
ncbi:hypothetical protein GRAN_4989 [Granulicella sibirica]|uniref:Uncharacterized protein n=1 Tax=Granulicella sibirica TaxID=2479048 RepID=A0A4Q0SVU0_9BACT|nr:hypothetical protein GRAN_4989 [Granulicella sibirica]